MKILLPGLRAESPAGALAFYGIAGLVPPGARLCWSGDEVSGWRGSVEHEGISELSMLVDALCRAIASRPLAGLVEVAKDLNEVSPDAWREAVVDEDGVGAVLRGLSADAPLRSGGQVAMTPLCVYNFRSRGRLFDNIAKQDQALKEKELRALLEGNWRPKKDINTLGLDPAARRQDGAVIGPDPSADGVRGVPALLPLAARGLAAVAPEPHERWAAGGAFRRGDGRIDFEWPIFIEPVRAEAVPLVAARRWLDRAPAQRRSAGIAAVFASQVLRDERRLSAGRRVA
jgi:hypothetical protein